MGCTKTSSEYHVTVNGKDSAGGSKTDPLRTISAAARMALPGDVVTVHAGTYREWVSPAHGGQNDQSRIIYQAAPGEKVIIKGSEKVTNWENVDGNIWKVTLPNRFFGAFNPYKELIYGDWFNHYERQHHTGDVYLNGQSMFEVETVEEVKYPAVWEKALYPDKSLYTWCCEVDDKETTIWANFQGYDPNEEKVEINVRPACFFPRTTGINYITVRGFYMCHAATQWSPPTAEQTGLIGPNWSKGWIIENNVISDSRCTGICLGKERSTGHNEWTHLRTKLGTQRQVDVTFKALQAGWSKENIGSHVVRNNTIYNCEQAGICGNLGAVFSEITGNHIYDIHTKRQFGGAEIAGIKLHAPIDTLISNNHIHSATRGIWMDWQAQGTRISGNVCYANSTDDLFVEVSHGPYVVDNNILLSPVAFRNLSQGGALIHNLIAGEVRVNRVAVRFTHYHFPHSTAVKGMMVILGGDDRYLNNLFVGNQAVTEAKDPMTKQRKNKAALQKQSAENEITVGLSVYDDYPLFSEDWIGDNTSMRDYLTILLPVHIESNVYCNGAKPFSREVNPVVKSEHDPQLQLESKGDSVKLTFSINEALLKDIGTLVTTDRLGSTLQSETPYETPDGKHIIIDTDYHGMKRESSPSAGPFEKLNSGEQVVTVWDNIK